MKIKSCILRAAINFQAKGDARYYLNGVFIDRKHVMAADGCAAVMMEHGSRVRASGVIVKFLHKIPAKSVTTKINLLGKNSYAEHIGALGDVISIGMIELVEARYPDVNKVVSEAYEPYCGKQEKVAIQAKYLSLIDKSFSSARDFCHISILHRASNQAVGIEFHNGIIRAEYGNPMVCIMPARI